MTIIKNKKEVLVAMEAKAFIDENLEKDLSVKQICARFGSNKNKLQRGFKIVFNQTIHAYIMQQRLLRAAVILKHSDMPIKAIAAKVGYTYANFHSNFKKTFGYSPEKFRKCIPGFLENKSCLFKN